MHLLAHRANKQPIIEPNSAPRENVANTPSQHTNALRRYQKRNLGTKRACINAMTVAIARKPPAALGPLKAPEARETSGQIVSKVCSASILCCSAEPHNPAYPC